tara:strand:- start:35 stop:334 length:300 start_codon:yes stop_codon:yes gene_type:complete
MAISWKQYIKDCIKVGLESPIPYKVIPYKNGIGIKKIVFIKPIKNQFFIMYNLLLYSGFGLLALGFILFLVSIHFERQQDIKMFKQDQLTKSFNRSKNN